MPMYFPDLKSVRSCALSMQKNKDEKRYNGIVPSTEDELPDARTALGIYFRTVWNDVIQAVEIEQAATEDNYDELIMSEFLRIAKS